MTWRRALLIGLSLLVGAGLIRLLGSIDATRDLALGGVGALVVGAAALAGVLLVLVGTIGWGVSLGLKDHAERQAAREAAGPLLGQR